MITLLPSSRFDSNLTVRVAAAAVDAMLRSISLG